MVEKKAEKENNNNISSIVNSEEKEKEKPKGKKKSKLITYLIIVILLGLLSSLLYSFLVKYIKAIPEVTVPDVVGLDKNDATFILKKNRLEPFLGGSRFSEETTPNIILSTDPEAGSTVKAGRKIQYILNIGQEQVSLPELKGLFPNQAETLLQEYNLYLQQLDEEFSIEHKEGTIIKTSPDAGEYMHRTSTVNYTLSKGFPVTISFEKIREGESKAFVTISLQVPSTAVTKQTNIKIISFSQTSHTPKTLFNEDIPSGKEVVFEFEEMLGNKIDVFYNDILAKTGIVIY